MSMNLLLAAAADASLWTWLRENRPDRSCWHLFIRNGRGGPRLAEHFSRIHRCRYAAMGEEKNWRRRVPVLRRKKFDRVVILCNNNTGEGYAGIRRFAAALSTKVEMVMLDGRCLAGMAKEPDRLPSVMAGDMRPVCRAVKNRARMTIGLDCRTYSPWRAGIGDYVAQLAPRLVKLFPKADFVIYQTPQAGAPARGGRVQVIDAPEISLQLPREREFHDRVAANRHALFHALGPFGPLWRFCPTVLTVHDLSQRRHPECFYPDRVRYFQRAIRPMLNAANAVLADSETMRDEIMAAYAVPGAIIRAVPLAPTIKVPRRPPAPPYGLRPGYLLYIGTIEPRKNIGQLVDALLPLWRTGRLRVPLVLAGKRGWLQDELLARCTRLPWLKWLGYVPARDLPALLGGARMMIYPSRYEGFGLPVANAMAGGVPVITTPGGALGELAGDAAALACPDDKAGLQSAVLRLLHDEDWHAELARRGRRRARGLSWDSHARTVAAIYRSLLARRQ